MSKKNKINIEEIKKQYVELSPLLIKFNEQLISVIEALLDENEVKLGFPIKGRVKTLDSLISKVESGKFSIKKSIQEVQDLSGCRIILLFKRDIEKIVKILSEHFDLKKSYNTQDKLQDDQFGYRSIHCIVGFPKSWLSVPIYSSFDGLTTEIQIRTLSQHNWAEFSHILSYSSEDVLPKSFNRSIGRVSALLEIVDFEFERLLSERENYIDFKEKQKSSLELDEEVLIKILDSKIPKKYKIGNENISGIVSVLKKGNILKALELENIIDLHLQSAIQLDNKICNLIIEDNNESQFILVDGIEFSTARFEEIKNNKGYNNQIGMLQLIFQKRKKIESL